MKTYKLDNLVITQEQLEALRRAEAWERCKKVVYLNGLDFIPDWSNGDQGKWCLIWAHEDKEIYYEHSYWVQELPNQIGNYFRSEEDAQKFWELAGEDWKIYMGVES